MAEDDDLSDLLQAIEGFEDDEKPKKKSAEVAWQVVQRTTANVKPKQDSKSIPERKSGKQSKSSQPMTVKQADKIQTKSVIQADNVQTKSIKQADNIQTKSVKQADHIQTKSVIQTPPVVVKTRSKTAPPIAKSSNKANESPKVSNTTVRAGDGQIMPKEDVVPHIASVKVEPPSNDYDASASHKDIETPTCVISSVSSLPVIKTEPIEETSPTLPLEVQSDDMSINEMLAQIKLELTPSLPSSPCCSNTLTDQHDSPLKPDWEKNLDAVIDSVAAGTDLHSLQSAGSAIQLIPVLTRLSEKTIALHTQQSVKGTKSKLRKKTISVTPKGAEKSKATNVKKSILDKDKPSESQKELKKAAINLDNMSYLVHACGADNGDKAHITLSGGVKIEKDIAEDYSAPLSFNESEIQSATLLEKDQRVPIQKEVSVESKEKTSIVNVKTEDSPIVKAFVIDEKNVTHESSSNTKEVMHVSLKKSQRGTVGHGKSGDIAVKAQKATLVSETSSDGESTNKNSAISNIHSVSRESPAKALGNTSKKQDGQSSAERKPTQEKTRASAEKCLSNKSSTNENISDKSCTKEHLNKSSANDNTTNKAVSKETLVTKRVKRRNSADVLNRLEEAQEEKRNKSKLSLKEGDGEKVDVELKMKSSDKVSSAKLNFTIPKLKTSSTDFDRSNCKEMQSPSLDGASSSSKKDPRSYFEVDKATKMTSTKEKIRQSGSLLELCLLGLDKSDVCQVMQIVMELSSDFELYMRTSREQHGSIFVSCSGLDMVKTLLMRIYSLNLGKPVLTVMLKHIGVYPPIEIQLELSLTHKHCLWNKSMRHKKPSSELKLYEVTYINVPKSGLAMCYPYVLLGCLWQHLDALASDRDPFKRELRFIFSFKYEMEAFLNFYSKILINGNELLVDYQGPLRPYSHSKANFDGVPRSGNPTGLIYVEQDEVLIPQKGSCVVRYSGVSFPYSECRASRDTPRIRYLPPGDRYKLKKNIDGVMGDGCGLQMGRTPSKDKTSVLNSDKPMLSTISDMPYTSQALPQIGQQTSLNDQTSPEMSQGVTTSTQGTSVQTPPIINQGMPNLTEAPSTVGKQSMNTSGASSTVTVANENVGQAASSSMSITTSPADHIAPLVTQGPVTMSQPLQKMTDQPPSIDQTVTSVNQTSSHVNQVSSSLSQAPPPVNPISLTLSQAAPSMNPPITTASTSINQPPPIINQGGSSINETLLKINQVLTSIKQGPPQLNQPQAPINQPPPPINQVMPPMMIPNRPPFSGPPPPFISGPSGGPHNFMPFMVPPPSIVPPQGVTMQQASSSKDDYQEAWEQSVKRFTEFLQKPNNKQPPTLGKSKRADRSLSPMSLDSLGMSSPKLSHSSRSPQSRSGSSRRSPHGRRLERHLSPKRWDRSLSPSRRDGPSSFQRRQRSPRRGGSPLSPQRRQRSMSPRRRNGSSSPQRRKRSVSPKRRDDLPSTKRRQRSVSPRRRNGTPSPQRKQRSVTPKRKDGSPSSKRRQRSVSPRRRNGSPSPRRNQRSVSPRRHDRSMSPRRNDRSVFSRLGTRPVSPQSSHRSISPNRPGDKSRSISPRQKDKPKQTYTRNTSDHKDKRSKSPKDNSNGKQGLASSDTGLSSDYKNGSEKHLLAKEGEKKRSRTNSDSDRKKESDVRPLSPSSSASSSTKHKMNKGGKFVPNNGGEDKAFKDRKSSGSKDGNKKNASEKQEITGHDDVKTEANKEKGSLLVNKSKVGRGKSSSGADSSRAKGNEVKKVSNLDEDKSRERNDNSEREQAPPRPDKIEGGSDWEKKLLHLDNSNASTALTFDNLSQSIAEFPTREQFKELLLSSVLNDVLGVDLKSSGGPDSSQQVFSALSNSDPCVSSTTTDTGLVSSKKTVKKVKKKLVDGGKVPKKIIKKKVQSSESSVKGTSGDPVPKKLVKKKRKSTDLPKKHADEPDKSGKSKKSRYEYDSLGQATTSDMADKTPKKMSTGERVVSPTAGLCDRFRNRSRSPERGSTSIRDDRSNSHKQRQRSLNAFDIQSVSSKRHDSASKSDTKQERRLSISPHFDSNDRHKRCSISSPLKRKHSPQELSSRKSTKVNSPTKDPELSFSQQPAKGEVEASLDSKVKVHKNTKHNRESPELSTKVFSKDEKSVSHLPKPPTLHHTSTVTMPIPDSMIDQIPLPPPLFSKRGSEKSTVGKPISDSIVHQIPLPQPSLSKGGSEKSTAGKPISDSIFNQIPLPQPSLAKRGNEKSTARKPISDSIVHQIPLPQPSISKGGSEISTKTDTKSGGKGFLRPSSPDMIDSCVSQSLTIECKPDPDRVSLDKGNGGDNEKGDASKAKAAISSSFQQKILDALARKLSGASSSGSAQDKPGLSTAALKRTASTDQTPGAFDDKIMAALARKAQLTSKEQDQVKSSVSSSSGNKVPSKTSNDEVLEMIRRLQGQVKKPS